MKKGNAGGLQRDNAAAMKKKSLFRMVKPYLFLLPIYLLMVTFKYIPFGNGDHKVLLQLERGQR